MGIYASDEFDEILERFEGSEQGLNDQVLRALDLDHGLLVDRLPQQGLELLLSLRGEAFTFH